MAIGAAGEDDRIAVAADEARRPATLDRFANERQRHARRRGLASNDGAEAGVAEARSS